jgi:hypothetical protein
MRLLSTDISKVKRLSLREVKLPTPERKVDPITPTLVERPLTAEELTYSKLITINPLLEELVDRLDLISNTTGERIKKVELKTEIKPQLDLKTELQKIKGEANYSKIELLSFLSLEIVESLIKAKDLILTRVGTYYLRGSTPF